MTQRCQAAQQTYQGCRRRGKCQNCPHPPGSSLLRQQGRVDKLCPCCGHKFPLHPAFQLRDLLLLGGCLVFSVRQGQTREGSVRLMHEIQKQLWSIREQTIPPAQDPNAPRRMSWLSQPWCAAGAIGSDWIGVHSNGTSEGISRPRGCWPALLPWLRQTWWLVLRPCSAGVKHQAGMDALGGAGGEVRIWSTRVHARAACCVEGQCEGEVQVQVQVKVAKKQRRRPWQ